MLMVSEDTSVVRSGTQHSDSSTTYPDPVSTWPALMAVWSKMMPLTASCFSLPEFETWLEHEGYWGPFKAPRVTGGCSRPLGIGR